MTLAIGMVICGFLVNSVKDLPDVDGRLWRMTYQKNGAELVWLEREDEVKTFAIAFKTLPEDNTGVAHILEHSVLSGSEKYPVRSPFDELRKSSLRVFMNAMTSRDVTCYPFSTRNDQDFLNLADVYLDAVFHPTVIKSPLAFRQEGWHYEIDPKSGALSYNGVVYNEMKGAFAEPERIAGRELLHHLYPDIVYGYESGGKPSDIPHLTYEKFCAFYRKYYHPGNARIFLDGSVDLSAVLPKIDSFLSAFDRVEKVPPIPLQRPVSRSLTIPYASADGERKTILADAWMAGTYEDIVRQTALDILADYLAGSNEAPLKKALLSRGLCDDVQMYCSGFQQVPLVLTVRNTSDEQAAQCRETIRQTVGSLLETGLDHARIRALINRNEFSERELDISYPRGLVFFSRAIGQWLYGGDPAAAFDLTGIFGKLREGVDAGFFEKCLREAMIDNPHHVELTFSPSKACFEEEAKRVSDELAELQAKLSPEEVAAIRLEAQELSAYQQRQDTEEEKATIPTLKLSDIPKSGRIVEHSIATNGTVTVVTTKPTADGVAYVSAYFPADGLCADELKMLPLLASLFGKLPTTGHDALSLQTEIAGKVGRLAFSTASTERGNFLVATVAVLTDKCDDALALLKEILFQTRFEDQASVAKILRQRCISAEREVSTRGDAFALRYAARGLSRRNASRDLLHGYEQLRWLQSAEVDAEMVRQLASLAKKVLTCDGMVLSLTDNLPARARDAFATLSKGAAGERPGQADLSLEAGSVAGMGIDADAGYSGSVALLPPDMRYDGSMRVAAKILSLGFLHRQIREIGGAYGTGIGISPEGLISSFTYRDPSPAGSVSTIRRSGDELMAFARSGEALDRYVVATIAALDPYRSPADEASRPVELFLAKRTVDDLQRERDQILSTTPKDLELVAEMLRGQLEKAQSFVVGGSAQVAPLPSGKVEPLRRK